jgi:hypothetical protein
MIRFFYFISLFILSINAHSSWQNDILSGKADFLKSEKFTKSVSVEKISEITGDAISAVFIRNNILLNEKLINDVSYKYVDDIYKTKDNNIDYYIDLETFLNAPTSTIYICFGENETPVSGLMPAGMIELESCEDEISFANKIVVKNSGESEYVFEVLDKDYVVFSGIYLNNKNMLELLKKYINSIGGWKTDLIIIGGNENIKKISKHVNLIKGVSVESIEKYRSGFNLSIITKLSKTTLIYKIGENLKKEGFSEFKLVDEEGGLLLQITEENDFHLNIKEGCACPQLFVKINDSGLYISQIANSGSTIILKSHLSKSELIQKLNLKEDEGQLFYEKELVWYQWFLDIFNKIKSFF